MRLTLEEAVAAIDDGRVDDAIRILEQMASSEHRPEVLVYLGIAYVQAERAADAVEVLERAKDQVEDHCVLSLFLGRALRVVGRFKEAEDELRNAIRLDSNSRPAWEDLAHVLYFSQQYKEALDITIEGLNKFPDSFNLRSICATSYHRMGDYDAEAEQWKRLLEQIPESMMALSNLAYIYLIQENIPEALPYIERAESISSNDCRPRVLRSEVLIQRGEFAKAKKILDSVINDDPCMPAAIIRMAVVSHHLNKYDETQKYIQMANDVLKGNPRKWWALYYLYSSLDRENDMYDCIINGTKEDPNSATPWIVLANYHENNGNTEESLAAWIKSIELRGYVKYQCSNCKKTLRVSYQPNYFDLNEMQFCPECNEHLIIPTHLARY